jgi:hypothetical protein
MSAPFTSRWLTWTPKRGAGTENPERPDIREGTGLTPDRDEIRGAPFVLDGVACAPEPVAWRLYSRRLDRELWVARDSAAATALDADGARAGLPVILADDLERLRDFDDQRLRDLLEVLAMFPGARIAALDSEVAS